MQRLDKFLCDSGIGTRSQVKGILKSGRVTVDGKAEKDGSRKIDPQIQEICCDGEALGGKRRVVLMLNKPAGFVTATEDKLDRTVMELLPKEYAHLELKPVGRLDKDTVGLMILTNNGPLAHSLLSPKKHVEKVYRFSCADPLCDGTEQLFQSGITLRDGYECKSARLCADADRMGGTITLTEGKYHQIKRMVASLGNKVVYLERISFGDISLDEGLERGQWRYLTDKEEALLISKGGTKA